MAKSISTLEPLIQEPGIEAVIPVIVGYKGYETARGIQQIYDSYSNSNPQQERKHLPQPFLRGSSLPPTPVAHRVSASSGGVIPTETDDLPRREDGEVDYEQIRSGMEGLRRRMNRVADDIQESRDRLDILGI
jgi:hypothetical protein